MRLSWPEIRTRAKAFAADHADDRNEIADTQTFYNDFFRIFDIDRKRVATYERSAERINRAKGRIDLFWPGTLIVEQKSLGRDLFGAEQQAFDYLHALPDADMPRHLEKFAFILGRQVGSSVSS
jgi:hypothetical protein